MAYMTGFTRDVEKALFLRKFAAPFRALAYCFGKHGIYWYRMKASPGRNNLDTEFLVITRIMDIWEEEKK